MSHAGDCAGALRRTGRSAVGGGHYGVKRRRRAQPVPKIGAASTVCRNFKSILSVAFLDNIENIICKDLLFYAKL